MKLIFLATPMDFTQSGENGVLRLWKDEARRALVEQGMAAYDPSSAWVGTVGTELDRRIEGVNQVAMGRGDGVLALLPPGVASIGVPMEIERALNSSIPVAVAGGKGSQALEALRRRPNLAWSPDGTGIGELATWLSGFNEEDVHANRRDVMGVTGPGELPTRAYEGDAGFDLYVHGDHWIVAGSSQDVPMGINVELPWGRWALLIGRSSTFRRRQLEVLPAVIDNGYRGELFAYVTNRSPENVIVRRGERLAQLIPLSMASHVIEPRFVEALSPSERAMRGFGSSGD